MHAIYFVDDSELPAGHDFVLVEIPDGALVFYRESALSPQVLEDSWTAYRELRSTHAWSRLPLASSI